MKVKKIIMETLQFIIDGWFLNSPKNVVHLDLGSDIFIVLEF